MARAPEKLESASLPTNPGVIFRVLLSSGPVNSAVLARTRLQFDFGAIIARMLTSVTDAPRTNRFEPVSFGPSYHLPRTAVS